VYSLPLGKSFTHGPPDFTLHAHTAPDSNNCYGSGPKNNCFSKDGTVLFSCNELDSSVSSYSFDARNGHLSPLGSPQMALPQEWLDSNPPRPLPFYDQCHSGGSLVLSPDGKHLYATNRGHDSIAGFAIGENSVLAPTAQKYVFAGGKITWNLTMPSDTLVVAVSQYADDPAGRAGLGKDADPKATAPEPKNPGNIRVFRRDQATGALTPTGAVREVDCPLGILAADDVRWGA
jgi:6-phosphogluconolactonase (cycloisomerase 2 family)